MSLLTNPYRGQSLGSLSGVPFPSIVSDRPTDMLKRCPSAGETPLASCEPLAKSTGVATVHVKDESDRMGLGSFKALGAAYVIASEAMAEGDAIKSATYVTASAGNHGLSVAAGAAAFGAQSVVYLAETVPTAFADRLRSEGATVVVEGAIYEESMEAAKQAADANGWRLLSDSSWDGYLDRPHRLMEGYLVLMAETVAQIGAPPSHIFVQAGVGGLACAVAALARDAWGDTPIIIVVEPDQAPALQSSIRAGKSVVADGGVSDMGRLDCKEPSLIALKGLARDADFFLTISEDEGFAGRDQMAELGFVSSTSGAAGFAGLIALTQQQRTELNLTQDSTVLAFLSEGPA